MTPQTTPRQQYSYDAFLSGWYQTEVRLAFDCWEPVANIEFVEVTDPSAKDVRLGFVAVATP